RRSLGELKDECERIKAAADPDPDATHKRTHDERSCRKRKTSEFGGQITYSSTIEEINEVWSVVTGFANQQFDLAFFRRRCLGHGGRLGQRRIYWRSTCEPCANAEFVVDTVRVSGRKPERWPP